VASDFLEARLFACADQRPDAAGMNGMREFLLAIC